MNRIFLFFYITIITRQCKWTMWSKHCWLNTFIFLYFWPLFLLCLLISDSDAPKRKLTRYRHDMKNTRLVLKTKADVKRSGMKEVRACRAARAQKQNVGAFQVPSVGARSWKGLISSRCAPENSTISSRSVTNTGSGLRSQMLLMNFTHDSVKHEPQSPAEEFKLVYNRLEESGGLLVKSSHYFLFSFVWKTEEIRPNTLLLGCISPLFFTFETSQSGTLLVLAVHCQQSLQLYYNQQGRRSLAALLRHSCLFVCNLVFATRRF